MLQDKCEPPVYVSDRRFMKAINLLQVAAHSDGRSQVGCCESLAELAVTQLTADPLVHAEAAGCSCSCRAWGDAGSACWLPRCQRK